MLYLNKTRWNKWGQRSKISLVHKSSWTFRQACWTRVLLLQECTDCPLWANTTETGSNGNNVSFRWCIFNGDFLCIISHSISFSDLSDQNVEGGFLLVILLLSFPFTQQDIFNRTIYLLKETAFSSPLATARSFLSSLTWVSGLMAVET